MVKKQYAYILLLPVAIYLTVKFGYAHNITESLPYKHFFVVLNGNVSKGNYVLFNAPETSKYSGMKLVKQVVGVEGDQVLVEKDQVFVNWIEVGAAKSHSKNGDKLTITQELKYLEENIMWLQSMLILMILVMRNLD